MSMLSTLFLLSLLGSGRRHRRPFMGPFHHHGPGFFGGPFHHHGPFGRNMHHHGPFGGPHHGPFGGPGHHGGPGGPHFGGPHH